MPIKIIVDNVKDHNKNAEDWKQSYCHKPSYIQNKQK